MRRVLIALALFSSTLLAQEPTRVLTRADFGTPTVVSIPAPSVANVGDFPFGTGTAIRQMPQGGWHAGHWHVYSSSWPDTIMLEYELPVSLSGPATFIQKIGDFTHYSQMGGDSLFFDDDTQRLCISSGAQYTLENGRNTLVCAEMDFVTGKLKTATDPVTGVVTVPKRSWNFQVCVNGVCVPRPDRMTQSGVLRIRNEEIAQKLKGHYVAGFGGTYSVIANGVSMGFSGCSFELPPQSYSGPITCIPILGYPTDSRGGANYMNRDGDYMQVLGWDTNPQRGSDAIAKYGTGKFAPEDGLYGMAADIIDVNGAQAFVGVCEIQRGCIAYGDNYYNLPPIVYEPGIVTPSATDLSTGEVTINSSWDTGKMVFVRGKHGSAANAGLVGEPYGYYVYFLRKTADNKYLFFRNLDMAQGSEGIIPVSTDTTNNIIKFSQPHGIVTQMGVTVTSDSGGLVAGKYYVNASRPNELSFHMTFEDAAGYPFTAARSPVDLTGPVTSMIVPPPVALTGPLTSPLQPASYCQSPSAPVPYPKATVQSQGARHVVYFYDINDLQSVANRQIPQNGVQPRSFENLDLLGVTYPVGGMGKRAIAGVQWIPEKQLFAISVKDSGNKWTGRKIWFYPVSAGVSTSRPSRAIIPSVVQ